MNAANAQRPLSILPRATLEALAAKYEALERLRGRRDLDLAHPPREDLRRLSQAFPGCLRELDRLTAVQLAARLAAVRDVLKGQEPPLREPPSETVELAEDVSWIGWISRYHELVRHELSLLKLVAGTRPATKREATLQTDPSGLGPAASKPSTRALAALAEETGLEAQALAVCLFPPRR